MNTSGVWQRKWSPAFLFLSSAILTACAVILLSTLWQARAGEGEPAPEAERILAAQADLPFQIFIPGFLPRQFKRADVSIESRGLQPGEIPAIRLVYPTRDGRSLVIEQSMAENAPSDASMHARLVDCRCQCQTGAACQPGQMEFQIGPLKVSVAVSSPDLITMQELTLTIETMGPAANQQAYSDMESVPLSEFAPPAVEIEVNAQGVQELTLVVTPDGYQPAHFAVSKDIPVRLIFRQVGYVSCGNELLFAWSRDDQAYLVLDTQTDKEVLEFTPTEPGEFRFNCPHLIYQGLMTVRAD